MVPADAFPEGRPCCDPSFALEASRELEKEERPQEKKFYSTYPMKWERLDMEKRQRTFFFFSKLDSSVKISASAKATEEEKTSSSEGKTEANVATKRDKSRASHLFADPRLDLDWQALRTRPASLSLAEGQQTNATSDAYLTPTSWRLLTST